MTTNNNQSTIDSSNNQEKERLLADKLAVEQAQAKRNKLRKEVGFLSWYGGETKDQAESDMVEAMIDLVGDTYNNAFGFEDEERWEEQPDLQETQDYATAQGIDYCLVNNIVETGMEEICYQSYERLMNTYEDCEADAEGAMAAVRKEWPNLLRKAREAVDRLAQQAADGTVDPVMRKHILKRR